MNNPTKYLTTQSLKKYHEMMSKKISGDIENSKQFSDDAIEDLGQEISDLSARDEREVNWLEKLTNDQEEIETSLMTVDNNVYSLRLFVFFSFFLNVIFFILTLAGFVF